MFRGDADALSVLATNVLFLVVAAAVTVADLKPSGKELGRLQRELALGDMRVIQKDKFRNERVFPLASLRQAARVAIVSRRRGKSREGPRRRRRSDAGWNKAASSSSRWWSARE